MKWPLGDDEEREIGRSEWRGGGKRGFGLVVASRDAYRWCFPKRGTRFGRWNAGRPSAVG